MGDLGTDPGIHPGTVPIIEIHNENFHEMWPSLLLALKSASFVAIDTELSGLGNRAKLNAKCIDDRYAVICELARSHSIISLGLSCFKLQGTTLSTSQTDTDDCVSPGDTVTVGPGKNRQFKYLVQSFNIPLLCSESYVVDPSALKFLVGHKFDFNTQYSRGLPYRRGNDVAEDRKPQTQNIRRLFCELMVSDVPVIFHNALIDLVFLYQCFYCDLPPSLASFLADLSEACPGGIYDTKYISEFKARWSASYLEYVFRKSERDNTFSAFRESSHIQLTFPRYQGVTESVTYQQSSPADSVDTDHQKVTEPCKAFGAHGWCSAGKACLKSHDIDVILDSEEKAMEKKRHRRSKHKRKGTPTEDGDMVMDTMSNSCDNDSNQDTDMTCCDSVKSTCRTGSHSAGHDAFMTGFTFAYCICKYAKCRSQSETVSFSDIDCSDMVNKVCLTGKDIPLQVVRSNFAKTSKNHKEKLEWLKLAMA
ncbi:Target of EGR1 protein 1 [Lamellibrachia satsuma]|nr:Target of EGR1 protein 1 [Lamellibrachia satsuma]